MNIFSNLHTEDEETILAKSRLFALKTLSFLSLELLQNCYQAEKQERITNKIKEFMEPIF
jgi:hypothetical protein